MALYAVTNRNFLGEKSLAQQVREAVENGATCVQLREKYASDEEILSLAEELIPICRKAGIPFIMNDSPELAARCGADGVHVGQSDMSVLRAREILGPDKIIGTSAHNVEEARKAEAEGADYIGCGAVFGSNTKKDASVLDHEVLKNITGAVSIPVVAIGGIQEDNVQQLCGTGIDGIAVVSALFNKKDIGGAARRLRALSGRIRGTMEKVLTIAGSDCSGGAGIQADLKTITAHGMYGMSAITALTAQNTMGVTGIQEAEPEFLQAQLDCIFEDIIPDCIKIGMTSGRELIRVMAGELKRHPEIPIVLDPVMVSTSGSRLLTEEAVETLTGQLFPLASLITPNIPEAEVLWGKAIRNREQMELAAEDLADRWGTAVLIKGGHLPGEAGDLLWADGEKNFFTGERIENPNTHGTGCTLSSAIACRIAAGCSLPVSVRLAKEYITEALKAGLDLGRGSGPLNHMVLLPEQKVLQ